MSPTLSLFSDACRELYAPGLQIDAFASRGFAFLRRLIPAEMIACGTLDLKTQNLDIGFDVNHVDLLPAMEALGKLMPKYDLYNWDPNTNEGRPFCRSHFYSARQFRDLDVYHEVYRVLGIDNHCAVHVPTRPGEVMFFGIERNGGSDFSSDELQLLELAQNHLANAHSLARVFGESAEEKVEPALLVRAGLTAREADVLHWMNRGKSNAEIATLLKISLYTVKDHVGAIFNKIGVCNRLAAVGWARKVCCHSRFQPEKRGAFVQVSATSPQA